MVQFSKGGDFAASTQSVEKPKILFIGSELDYSEQSLRAVHREFQSFETVRLATLSDVTLFAQFNSNIALVVLSEPNATHLVQAFEACQAASKSARIAFSYRDADLASQLLRNIVPEHGLQMLSFLPMDKQIDCWLAIVGLLLRQETYVPTDLIQKSLMPANQTPPLPAMEQPDAISTEPVQPMQTDDCASLTTRENEVLALVAKGQQNKTIANLLDVSEHTVKLHIHNVIRKLGVSNRTAAAAWYHSSFANADPGTGGPTLHD